MESDHNDDGWLMILLMTVNAAILVLYVARGPRHHAEKEEIHTDLLDLCCLVIAAAPQSLAQRVYSTNSSTHTIGSKFKRIVKALL